MSNIRIKTLEEISQEIGLIIGKFIDLDNKKFGRFNLSESKIRMNSVFAYFKSKKGHDSKYKIKKEFANHYGEYIAYIILKQLEKKVCKVELAKTKIKHPFKKEYISVEGVLSHFHLQNDETFLPANVLVEDYINSHPKLNTDEYFSIRNYTDIELLLNAFEYKFKTNGQEEKIPEMRRDFFDMCAFDMIFANRDRHEENLGLRVNQKTGEVNFYHLFDNEQILGMQESKDNVTKYLSSENEFNLFKNKELTSYIGIPGQPLQVPFENLLEYLLEHYENEILTSIEDISRYTVSDLKELMSMCDGLSEEHQNLAVKIFNERMREINYIIEDFKQKNNRDGFSRYND